MAPALAEVTEQRLGYITMLFRQFGYPEARARRRAVFAYSAYLGQLQLVRSAPDLLPKPGPPSCAYADDVLAALLADRPSHDAAPIRRADGGTATA